MLLCCSACIFAVTFPLFILSANEARPKLSRYDESLCILLQIHYPNDCLFYIRAYNFHLILKCKTILKLIRHFDAKFNGPTSHINEEPVIMQVCTATAIVWVLGSPSTSLQTAYSATITLDAA